MVRFADKPAHQILILSPAPGARTHGSSTNRPSTSLPGGNPTTTCCVPPGPDGRRRAMCRPLMPVEYDFCAAHLQIHAPSRSKRARVLASAGQINGTSGHEEAAAQGLMAEESIAALALM